MKITTLCTAVLAATLASSMAEAPAKSPDNDWNRRKGEFLERLPDELKAKFRAAREAALQNPEIAALRQEAEAANAKFRDAMREAIAKADPELAEKVRTHMEKNGSGKGPKKNGDRPKGPGAPDLSKLAPQEKDRLQAAREIAKQAPAVQSAEAAMKSAQSPEERRAAAEKYHTAMREAMLTADPSLAPVLEKIRPPQPPQIPASTPIN
jgi:hypothetical protein